MNEPDNTSRASNLPFLRGRVLSILGIVLGISVLVVLVNQNAQQTARMQHLDEKFVAMETAINNQTAVLDRAIGKTIPIVLPADLMGQLAQLELVLKNQNSWPKTPIQSDELQSHLAGVVHKIPPWAEEDETLLPRLNAIRWGCESLALLSQANSINKKSTNELADRIGEVLGAAPDGADETIKQRLQSEQAALSNEYNDFRKTSAIETANNAVSANPLDAQSLTLAWSGLDEWKTDTEINQLRNQLRSSQIELQINSWNSTLSKIENENDISFKQAVMTTLLMQATNVRQELLNDTGISDDTKTHVSKICAIIQKSVEKAVADEQQVLSLNYQKWALDRQIRQYKAAIISAKTALPGKTPGDLFGRNTSYEAVRDAMVRWLVPISPSYLDPGTAIIFNEQWNEGWNLLKNQKDTNQADLQTEVAEQEATVKKRSLTDAP